MFGLDPFSRPVAIAEMLLLLSLAAFVGWLIARFILTSRVSALQAEIAERESELNECRRAKVAVPVAPAPANIARPEPVVAAPPVVPVMVAPSVEVPTEAVVPVEVPVAVVAVAVPVMATTPIANSEDAVLNRIASRAGEINFDRIGRASAADADDLKDIVGVGPFLERKLHSLGIFTFRQVGNFTKEDIDKVNEIIEFFPGRIERDNWVSQSKAFYEKKYGDRVNG